MFLVLRLEKKYWCFYVGLASIILDFVCEIGGIKWHFINFIQKKEKEQNKQEAKLHPIHKNTIFIAAREHFK